MTSITTIPATLLSCSSDMFATECDGCTLYGLDLLKYTLGEDGTFITAFCTMDNGGVIAADRHNGRLLVFDAQFNLVRLVGKRGVKLGEFNDIQALCRGVDNSIVVVDSADFIHVVSMSSKDDTIRSFRTPDHHPRSACVRFGELPIIFVAYSSFSPISALTWEGEIIRTISEPGFNMGQVGFPSAIAYDHIHDQLMVVDSYNEMIYVFQPDGEWEGAVGVHHDIRKPGIWHPSSIHIECRKSTSTIFVGEDVSKEVYIYDWDGKQQQNTRLVDTNRIPLPVKIDNQCGLVVSKQGRLICRPTGSQTILAITSGVDSRVAFLGCCISLHFQARRGDKNKNPSRKRKAIDDLTPPLPEALE